VLIEADGMDRAVAENRQAVFVDGPKFEAARDFVGGIYLLGRLDNARPVVRVAVPGRP
jgi:hypothetical protein